MAGITVYGADWCADCHRARAVLDGQGADYEYLNIDDDDAAREAMLTLANGRNSIPLIVFSDGSMVQEPSNAELLAALEAAGNATVQINKNKEETMADTDKVPTHDVIMIGAGPAALAAAIYTTREDIDTLLFERAVIGGLAAITDKIDNYPGFPDGVEGLTLAQDLQKQAERFGAVIELGEVTEIHDEGAYKRLETTSGTMRAKAVLIATGSDYKKIGVPGEQELYGRGVHYCATCDGAFYRDKRLAVIGGGNSAVQEAIFLTRFTSHIDLLVRSTIKASDVLQKDLHKMVDEGKITVHLGITPKEIVGKDNTVSAVVGAKTDGSEVTYDVDGVFIFVGLLPNSQFLQATPIRLDEIGLVITDQHLMTTMPGVFAAGDIRSGATLQIASASGEGATAALKIREYLEGQFHPIQN